MIKESNKRGVLNRHEVSMVCNAFATNFRITLDFLPFSVTQTLIHRQQVNNLENPLKSHCFQGVSFGVKAGWETPEEMSGLRFFWFETILKVILD